MSTVETTDLKTPKSWLTLGVFLLIVIGIGGLIGASTAPGEWYASLEKPPFNPPNWVFGPVWTTLFALMAYGVFRILRLPAGMPGRNATWKRRW